MLDYLYLQFPPCRVPHANRTPGLRALDSRGQLSACCLSALSSGNPPSFTPLELGWESGLLFPATGYCTLLHGFTKPCPHLYK